MLATFFTHGLRFLESEYLVTGPALAMGLFLLGFLLLCLFRQYLNVRRENRIFQLELGINTRIEEKNYELNERLLRLNEQIQDMDQEIDPSLSLFEQNKEAMIMVCDDRILDMNHAAMDLFGFSIKEEYLSANPKSLFFGKHNGGSPPKTDYNDFVKTACDKGYSRFTWQNSRPDGSLIHGETIISCITRCGRQILLLSIRDMENHARIENELRATLEKMLAANDAKNRFLATMSHEIRTPLNGIIGISELMMDTGPSEEQQKLLSTIDHEASSLLSIINDILDYSKIEAGKLELENIDFNFNIMMGGLSRIFSARARMKHLDFHLHISPQIPINLQGDPGKLRQVLVNLLGNALKFTNKGDISISVERVAGNDDHVELLFKVTDTGIGISPDKHETIFESFTQAEHSTSRRYGGTGLGTTIAKQLVELMGGRIELLSSPGLGTTFSFTALFGSRPLIATAKSNRRCLDQLKILVVGSTKDNRSRVIRHLKYQGCILDEAATVDDAFSLLEWALSCNKPHDIVILDLYMKNTKGFTLAQRIRSSEGTAHVPVLAVTSSGRRGDARKCIEKGIDGYLAWPITRNELIHAIETLAAQQADESPGGGGSLLTRYSLKEDYKSDFTILLGEDYPTNQKLILNHLTQAGYQTVLAENGRKVVDLFKKQSFDLILMDVRMPILDGLEATKIIRTLERENAPSDTTRIPIVALTADAMNGDSDTCFEAGMDDYFTKPINRKQLLNLVDRLAMIKWKKKQGIDDQDKSSDLFSSTITQNTPKKILLVEDTPINQKIIIQHLNSAGYDVDLSQNGLEGLELFKKKHYDLVIMDLQMPVMDGFASAREMRKFQTRKSRSDKQTPIIAVTANSQAHDREKCFDAGMDDFESKPIKRTRLLELVRIWTGESPGPARPLIKADPDKKNLPLDYDKALAEFQNDKVLLDDVLKQFLETIRHHIDDMSINLDRYNSDMIAQTAHMIKGGAANILAKDLSEAASTLEKIGKSGCLDQGPLALEQLKEEFKRLVLYADETYKIKIET
ncbi:MAG: response regulator [Proteobacteria bacterium]|nr:response regulator [Pseudomonadota bacterium]